MKKRIFLTASVLLLVLTLCISLCACGSGEEVSRIESKGLFVLEQSEDFDLSKEGELSEHETYLIHVYDILPHETENAEMGSWSSCYTATLNNTNEYETVVSKGDAFNRNVLNSFIIASQYTVDTEIGQIYGGQEPIRVISAFIVNKNDIHKDTVVDFRIEDSGIYNYDMSFQGEDVQKIQFFDEIYNIEENPHEYQLASTMYVRAKAVKSAMDYFSNNNGTENDMILALSTMRVYFATSLDVAVSFGDSEGIMLYDFDSNIRPQTNDDVTLCDQKEILGAVDKYHPEISETTKIFFENGLTWGDDVTAYIQYRNQETADKANKTDLALYEAACTIIEYFEEN